MSEPLQLAGRGRRLVATGIDALLVPTLSLFLVMVAGVLEDAEDYADSWWMLWVLLLAIASYLILNGFTLWRSGQTLGKRAVGIAIATVGANPDDPRGYVPAPMWKLVLIRAWAFPLLFAGVVPWLLPLPVIDQAFILGRRRRCLHDWMCGTEVVRLH